MSVVSRIKMTLSRIRTMLYFIKADYWIPLVAKYGSFGNNSYIWVPSTLDNPTNIFLGDNVRIKPHNKMLAVGNGRIIIKDNVDIAVGFTAVSSNHRQLPGTIRNGKNDDNEYRDIIIEEDVWIGANVTLLAGAHIGRGAIIGAGAVVRGQKIPPYAVVIGNPAKVIRFKFSLEEIVEHEKQIYEEQDRIHEQILKDNYAKYYTSVVSDIKQYKSLHMVQLL